jgi:hypothetical protein
MVTIMKNRLKMLEGKALYEKRKSTVKLVLSIVKHVFCITQFMLRGLDTVEKEWKLVCVDYSKGECLESLRVYILQKNDTSMNC